MAAAPDGQSVGITGGQGVDLEEPRSLRRLEGTAVAKGWVTAATPQKLEAVLNRQIMIAIDPKNDPRDSSRAANVVTKITGQIMEQEKRDTERELPPPGSDEALPPVPVQVNVQVNNNGQQTQPAALDAGVVIIQREDFFRNHAHQRQAANRLAEANGSPVADPGVSGTVQDADLRTPLGENGSRSNGHSDGSRSNGNGSAGTNGSH